MGRKGVYGKVQELLDGSVVGGAAVGEGDDVHAAVADEGVQIPCHLLYESLRRLLPVASSTAGSHRGSQKGPCT